MKKLILLGLMLVTSAMAASPTPQMQKVLDAMNTNNSRPINKMTADEARLQTSPQKIAQSITRDRADISDVQIKNIEVSGGESNLPARLYTPKKEGKLPVVLYFHGGGWVMGKNEDYDATLKFMAHQTGAIFLSVEYRKGPEHKFPAAHDDAYASYLWLLKNAPQIGGDPKRIVVAGESAGGNLAINVSIRARDQKQPLPKYQLLIYPVAGTDHGTKSYQENKNAKPLNSDMMNWFMKNYLRSTEDLKDKRINLVAADLKGLPPTTLFTAEIDPLRSEGRELASRLKEQGVTVDYRDYPGVTHEFFSMAPVLDVAKQAQKAAADDLKRSF